MQAHRPRTSHVRPPARGGRAYPATRRSSSVEPSSLSCGVRAGRRGGGRTGNSPSCSRSRAALALPLCLRFASAVSLEQALSSVLLRSALDALDALARRSPRMDRGPPPASHEAFNGARTSDLHGHSKKARGCGARLRPLRVSSADSLLATGALGRVELHRQEARLRLRRPHRAHLGYPPRARPARFCPNPRMRALPPTLAWLTSARLSRARRRARATRRRRS